MSCYIDIYAGLLGAGKTTLINRLLATEYKEKKIAIIENELGKINLDAGTFAGPNITVRELTNGCVCCTIRGDFSGNVEEIAETIHPDVILIEPTGAADAAGIVRACRTCKNAELRRVVMVANAGKLPLLLSVVGPFYIDQIKYASCIYLNFSDRISEEKLSETIKKVQEINHSAILITTPIHEVDESTFPGRADFLQNAESMDSASGPRRTRKVMAAKKEPSKMRPVGKRTEPLLHTRTIQVDKPLSEEEYEQLKADLLNPKNGDLWRAKGIVPMQDGELRRIDLTFGDFFETELNSAAEELVGTIILIGKK